MVIRAAVYLRISLDRSGDGLAIDRQRQDCQRIAADRGWEIVAEYVDQSISASDKRKDRPAYDSLVADHAAGKFDALIVWDLDRLTRQPRQLEDWIDAAEERGLLLVTANGEADLSTDGGRLFARIKASVARAEVERKSARQARAALQRAERGKPPLGVRLTGYTSQGQVVSDEAAVVADVFARFAAGESLKGLAERMQAAGIRTRHGKEWNPSTVRTMLVNPRYVGHAVYQGQVTGAMGDWEPLVDPETFAIVSATLADPRRRTQVGTDRKYLGSSLYLCGITGCGRAVRSHNTRYRCPTGGHLMRSRAAVDDHVLRYVRSRLREPEVSTVTDPDDAASRSTAGELLALRGRLVQIERDYDENLIDGRRYKLATEKVQAQIAEQERAARADSRPRLASVLAATDPSAAFDAAPLMVQRAVVDFFATVTLLPAPRGSKTFRPETVIVTPR